MNYAFDVAKEAVRVVRHTKPTAPADIEESQDSDQEALLYADGRTAVLRSYMDMLGNPGYLFNNGVKTRFTDNREMAVIWCTIFLDEPKGTA